MVRVTEERSFWSSAAEFLKRRFKKHMRRVWGVNENIGKTGEMKNRSASGSASGAKSFIKGVKKKAEKEDLFSKIFERVAMAPLLVCAFVMILGCAFMSAAFICYMFEACF